MHKKVQKMMKPAFFSDIQVSLFACLFFVAPFIVQLPHFHPSTLPPPYTAATFKASLRRSWLVSFWATVQIWVTNSRVGARTKASAFSEMTKASYELIDRSFEKGIFEKEIS